MAFAEEFAFLEVGEADATGCLLRLGGETVGLANAVVLIEDSGLREG